MIARLSSKESSDLCRASSDAIVEHLNRLDCHFREGRWLGTRNVYRFDPVVALRSRKPSTGSDRPLQLGDYVAASCPLHLWDGWTYLGLSVHAHLRGAIGNAKHLAYYAELRAAMALLASQGIGIFSDRHCIVEAPRSVLYLSNRGTHVATQLCLEHWADSVNAADLLSRIVTMERVSIKEWIGQLRLAGAWAPIGTDLIRQAGLDLKKMSDDRVSRNEASYRPTSIVLPPVRDVRTDVNFLVEMIGLLEPGASPGTFEGLDRFVCRRMLEGAFKAGTGKSDLQSAGLYRSSIESMLEAFIDSTVRREELERFLIREQEHSDPMPILAASQDGDQADPDYHLQIIGRAMLLLRIATGAIRETFDRANLSLDVLRFWWQSAGSMEGFWDDAPQIVDRSVLWTDIFQGLEDLYEWTQEGLSSRHNLLSTCADSIVQTTGLARITLVGLAS